MTLESSQPSLAPLDRQHLSSRLRKLIDFYEHLTDKTVWDLGQFYAKNAYFKDPFNEVNDFEAIRLIFADMFEKVSNPRFVVHTAFESGEQAFLAWNFLFETGTGSKQTTIQCRGSSHLKFQPDGKVKYHRDYWDVAEELYEKIPVLGALMRWIKKKAA